MLIEDNPGDACLVTEFLERAGPGRFRVIHAGGMDEAIGRCRVNGFEVIVLDLGLPDSQGMETFERLQSHPTGRPKRPMSTTTFSRRTEVLRVGGYSSRHTCAQFSYGLCPGCMQGQMDEIGVVKSRATKSEPNQRAG